MGESLLEKARGHKWRDAYPYACALTRPQQLLESRLQLLKRVMRFHYPIVKRWEEFTHNQHRPHTTLRGKAPEEVYLRLRGVLNRPQRQLDRLLGQVR